jgi:hypothetical protein
MGLGGSKGKCEAVSIDGMVREWVWERGSKESAEY